MSQTNPPRRIGRSVLAIVAGALAAIVLSVGTDAVLHAIGLYPPLGRPMSDLLLLLATAYRAVYGIAGSYIAARLAPDRPMWHALVLGAIGCAVSILGAVVTWNRTEEFGPHWYPLALVVLAMPQSWVGGRLREVKLVSQPVR